MNGAMPFLEAGRTGNGDLYEHQYPDFPLPRLLFGFRIEDSGRISGINIGVPDLGKLTPDTRMFVYPFSNVSRFAMCTGANSLHTFNPPAAREPSLLYPVPAGQRRLLSGTRQPAENGTSRSAGASADKDRRYYYDHVLVPMPKYNAEGLYLTMGGTKMTNEQAAALVPAFTANDRVACAPHHKDKSKGQVAAYVDSGDSGPLWTLCFCRENWQNRFCTVRERTTLRPHRFAS